MERLPVSQHQGGSLELGTWNGGKDLKKSGFQKIDILEVWGWGFEEGRQWGSSTQKKEK